MQKISFLQKITISQPLNKTALFACIIVTASAFPTLAQEDASQQPPKENYYKPFTPTVQENISKRVQDAEDDKYLSFSFENDRIGNGKDQNYTNGFRVTYFDVNTPIPPVIDKLAEAVPTFDINPTTSTFFTLGQNIYTPNDITISTDQLNARPWAAWLYGSVGMTTITKNHLDELEFTLGILGPEALGEQTQKFVHEHITNSPIPQGWDNQLETEPGLIVSWRRRWPVWYAENFGDFRLRVEPNINVSLGNVYTYAGTGIAASFGPGADQVQDMPPRVVPAMAGTGFFDTPDNKLSWFLFGGFDTRLMARNIFLDGNTFSSSDDIDKKYLVGDLSGGLALTYADYRLSYSLNYRTKEFAGQEDESVFGSLSLTTRF